jgi:hypothetical protein
VLGLENLRATSVRTRALSAAPIGASLGRLAAVLIAAMRLATSSRNGLTTPSTILNGTPRRVTFLQVTFGEVRPFQLLLAQLG